MSGGMGSKALKVFAILWRGLFDLHEAIEYCLCSPIVSVTIHGWNMLSKLPVMIIPRGDLASKRTKIVTALVVFGAMFVVIVGFYGTAFWLLWRLIFWLIS